MAAFPSWTLGVANHLWQSTLFAVCAWLLTLTLRRHHARARYVVWLAASIKFLIPFALLTAIGGAVHYGVQTPIASPPLGLLDAVDLATVPFASARVAQPQALHVAATATSTFEWLLAGAWIAGGIAMVGRWLLRRHRLASIVRRASPAESCRWDARVLSLARRAALPVAFIDMPFEPGVFGIVRPMLLWPNAVSERLSDEQIDAIVAHELCHVRWHDNASAALHMIVETLFWFHPLVWWIGARLIDERERACDEDVLRAGREAQAYAEGVLKVCEFQLASPLACVAGVTGSDLRRRITDIMRRRAGDTLQGSKRWMLVGAAAASILAPIGAAAWRGQNGQIPIPAVGNAAVFEVASIKQNMNGVSGPGAIQIMSLLRPGDRVRFVNQPLRMLMLAAYPGYTAIQGPEWIGAPGPPRSDVPRFDITAKADGAATHEQLVMMMRALLADRFKLVLHAETKDEPVYALVSAGSDGRLGSGLRREARDCESLRAPVRGTGTVDPCAVPPESNLLQFGRMSARSKDLDLLCNLLRTQVDRPVVNKTGLSGSFDWDLHFTPQRFLDAPFDASAFPLVEANGPTIFTAVQEQFGLKLVPEKDGQPFLVIDHVERPTEN